MSQIHLIGADGEPVLSDPRIKLSRVMANAGWNPEHVIKLAYSQADIHVDSYLTNFSIDYRIPEELIADDVLPVVKVEKQSNLYPIWARADANKVVEAFVGPSDHPAEVTQALTKGSYACQPRAIWARIPNDILAQADAPLDLMGQASRDVRGTLQKSRELRVANLVMAAGSYPSGNVLALTGNNTWDAAPAVSTANPLQDIMNGGNISAVAPNILVLSKKVWTVLRKHPAVVASVSGVAISGAVTGRIAQAAEISQLLGLKVLVGDAKYRSSADGAAETYQFIWGKGAALLYQAPGMGINTQSWGKTFRHLEMQFSTIYDQKPGVSGLTYVKGGHSDAENVTAKDMGYLIDGAIASASA